MHGGTIEAASSGIGRGSTFTVRLRRVAAVASASVLRTHPDALAGASVLVVDDSRDVLDFLGFVLSEHGAAVHLAASVSEAIATGYADATTQQRARDEGFDMHLSKPIDPDELVRAVARLRALPRGHEERA